MVKCLSKDWQSLIEKNIEQKKVIENQIKKELDRVGIFGYHCTRLTEDDYSSIKKHGLMILNKENQINRIRKLCLEENDKIQLIENIKEKDLSKREGQIHFVYSLDSIDSGCISFLKFWGGESICYNINNFKTVSKRILEISKPYIVKFRIKYSDIYNATLIENMKTKLKYGRLLEPCGGITCKNIKSEEIVDILKADEILSSIEKDNM